MKTIKTVCCVSILSLSLTFLLPFFSVICLDRMAQAQPGGCTLAPQWETFGPSAGTGTIEITAPSASYAWTAQNDSPFWISFTSGSSGTGNGTLTYSVTTNDTGQARTGIIQLDGKNFKVMQTEQEFADIPAGHWAKRFVQSLYAQGITGGCGDGNYCPDAPVTRGQMAVFILSSLGEAPAASCSGSLFNDTHAGTVGDSFCRYIERFSEMGITGGCQGDDPETVENEARYCPDMPVTRAQMAVFLSLVLQETPAGTCTGSTFNDVDGAVLGGQKGTGCFLLEREMPRIARGLCDGQIYHVINRGNGKQRVFRKAGDYKSFLSPIMDVNELHPMKVLAYCLMPNHFHLLLQPEKGKDLSTWMQWVMTSHVRRYHQHYGTSGHVWQGRYKSFIVQRDEHLLTVVRYIEANPVRAKLSESAKLWPWSSHADRIAGAMESFLDVLPIPLPARWTEYVDTPMTGSELERLRISVNRQSPYGKQEWQITLCKELGLESTVRPRGRPTKGK